MMPSISAKSGPRTLLKQAHVGTEGMHNLGDTLEIPSISHTILPSQSRTDAVLLSPLSPT